MRIEKITVEKIAKNRGKHIDVPNDVDANPIDPNQLRLRNEEQIDNGSKLSVPVGSIDKDILCDDEVDGSSVMGINLECLESLVLSMFSI